MGGHQILWKAEMAEEDPFSTEHYAGINESKLLWDIPPWLLAAMFVDYESEVGYLFRM
jgi:hypothetical protein